jgi:hypothetical protein
VRNAGVEFSEKNKNFYQEFDKVTRERLINRRRAEIKGPGNFKSIAADSNNIELNVESPDDKNPETKPNTNQSPQKMNPNNKANVIATDVQASANGKNSNPLSEPPAQGHKMTLLDFDNKNGLQPVQLKRASPGDGPMK